MIIKNLFKRAIKANVHKSANDDFGEFKTVLVSIFSRYGDGIIALKILKEFANKNPNTRFLIITTPQFEPYANEFFPNCAIGLNKRNPIALFNAIAKIKAFDADIGLNPWSFGDESKFFISFAKRYKDFATFKEFSKIDNLYDRVREYLNLELTPLEYERAKTPQNVKNIIFAPFSTDVTKSLDDVTATQFLKNLQSEHQKANVWLCGFKNEIKSFTHHDKFYFKRSPKTSKSFLDLLKNADLFVGVDAGPLHLAMAFDIPSVAIFGPTAPQTIINSYKNVTALRSPKLDGVFCFVENCKNPKCLKNELSETKTPIKNVTLENLNCPLI